jgi:hypothetical protein
MHGTSTTVLGQRIPLARSPVGAPRMFRYDLPVHPAHASRTHELRGTQGCAPQANPGSGGRRGRSGAAESERGERLGADAAAIGGMPAGTPVAFEAAYGWGWLVELLED